MNKWQQKLYSHMCEHYSKYSLAANMFLACSIAGLALLGVLTSVLTATMLIGWGMVFSLLYAIGKLLDQEIDDLEKNRGHHCNDRFNKDVEQ